MNKVWLKNYPTGVPAEINPNEYSSLTDLLERWWPQPGRT